MKATSLSMKIMNLIIAVIKYLQKTWYILIFWWSPRSWWMELQSKARYTAWGQDADDKFWPSLLPNYLHFSQFCSPEIHIGDQVPNDSFRCCRTYVADSWMRWFMQNRRCHVMFEYGQLGGIDKLGRPEAANAGLFTDGAKWNN